MQAERDLAWLIFNTVIAYSIKDKNIQGKEARNYLITISVMFAIISVLMEVFLFKK